MASTEQLTAVSGVLDRLGVQARELGRMLGRVDRASRAAELISNSAGRRNGTRARAHGRRGGLRRSRRAGA
jgi:Ser/Thr protein kinase RdoA (MazF antagonist)